MLTSSPIRFLLSLFLLSTFAGQAQLGVVPRRDQPGYQAWATNAPNNSLLQVSTNLHDWHRADNETAYPGNLRMTETAGPGPWFVRLKTLP